MPVAKNVSDSAVDVPLADLGSFEPGESRWVTTDQADVLAASAVFEISSDPTPAAPVPEEETE